MDKLYQITNPLKTERECNDCMDLLIAAKIPTVVLPVKYKRHTAFIGYRTDGFVPSRRD